MNCLSIYGPASLALSAGLALRREAQAVERLCENARAGSLSYSARAAEKVGLGHTSGRYRILQGCRQGLLPHDGMEIGRTVFPCRDYIWFVFFHSENLLVDGEVC